MKVGKVIKDRIETWKGYDNTCKDLLLLVYAKLTLKTKNDLIPKHWLVTALPMQRVKFHFATVCFIKKTFTYLSLESESNKFL